MANELLEQRNFLGLLYGVPVSGQKREGSRHRRVWSEAYGEIPALHEVHHIDRDPENNKLSNLACLPKNDHRALHGRPLKHYPEPAKDMAANPKALKKKERLSYVPSFTLLTVKGACSLLEISEATIRRWIKADKIKAYKMGRQWRFIGSELVEWVKNKGDSQEEKNEKD